MLRKNIVLLMLLIPATIIGISACRQKKEPVIKKEADIPETSASSVKPKWIIPDTGELANTEEGALIKYGRNLIVNTSFYFGPKGTIAHKSNGLNCQNCHLDAGTKLFGNNFSLVATSYPKYKERSASVETIVKKIEDCFERSLNGKAIDSNSREMKAFVAYLRWIGKNVPKNVKPEGSGIEELSFLNKAADTVKGRMVYALKCQSCHGKNGEGVLNAAGTAYTYPALWGMHSYNIGASIYRVSKFASYVKNNMPFGSSYNKQQLSNEDAWNVAAFVNSQPHPFKDISKDWPKIASKPYDYPFGPYDDNVFTKEQRKYGPFAPIKNYYAALAKKK